MSSHTKSLHINRMQVTTGQDSEPPHKPQLSTSSPAWQRLPSGSPTVPGTSRSDPGSHTVQPGAMSQFPDIPCLPPQSLTHHRCSAHRGEMEGWRDDGWVDG